MKKFLTFFAMMFALLGFSSQPINAADPEYTVYVDVSNKTGWDNVYIRTQWSSKDWGWPVQNKTERIAGTNIFKVVFEYGDFNNLTSIVFANRKADDYTPENECYDNGTGASGWFNKSENKLTMGALYTLNANNQQATITPNYTPATPPYIFINGSSTAFTGEGSNWVYTVDASTVDKGFRIQNAVDNTPLGSSVTAKVFLGTNDGFEVSATGTKTLKLWGSTDQYYTAKSGATYKLSIPADADLANYDKPFTLTITRTEAGPYIPAAPELPKTATSNKVTIPAVDKAEVYYIISATDPGEPNTTTWMKYTGAIELNAENVTIWAAAKATDSNGKWSSVSSQSYSYGMPVPTVSISNDGTVTISVSPLVDGANLMYGFSESTINQTYDSSNKPKATAGQTVYAKYVHTVLGSSDVASASYSGARTIKEIILYTRQNLQDGNNANSGKATAAEADGTWKLGTVSIPSGANSGYWNSTLCFEIKYSDGTNMYYSTSENELVNTIQANAWKNVYERSTWPLTENKNYGFFVEGSGGKNVTVYVQFEGDNIQVKATMPNNTLTLNSTPQITGYGIPSNSWSNYQDFSLISESPKTYEYRFTCGDPNNNQEYVWYGLKINNTQYRPANLSLGESTYTFTQGAPSGSNQATIKGLTTGVEYSLTLTETELGVRLSINESGIPKPVLVHDAKSNIVTINVPDGCTLHYWVGTSSELTATSTVTLTIPAEGMAVTAFFTKEGFEGQGETVKGNYTYYTAPQRWASKEWSLSDEEIMKSGTVKYFYLSRFQNDDRVSPEWELIANGDNTYTLDYFMCIPAAEFRLRRVAKDSNGNISYRDFGLDAASKIKPATLGVTSTPAAATVSKDFKIYGGSNGNKSRGYSWDMGYSMVSVKITDTTGGNDAQGPAEATITLSVDFSQPSTINLAPKPGIPYVALTGSRLQIPTIEGQNIKHAVELPDGYSNAFTNAWIQYDAESNMLVYGSGVTDNALYYSSTNCKPADGAVMNSTIMPPRNPIWFKLVDESGMESTVTSNKTILKYKGEEYHQFTTPGDDKGNNKNSTKENVRFAVYSLNDMEMSGLFKIFSGYSGRYYGSVANGLSLFHNWGVGHQGSKEPYASSVIPSKVAMPLNGGGPKTSADGSAWRDPASDTNKDYDKEDNWAGRYFEFDTRTYVSELNFYYALERDQEGANGTGTYLDGYYGLGDEDYNSHHAYKTDDNVGAHWNEPNYTNDGLNYSWFRFVYSGSIGQIKLDKTGVDSGRVTWSINKDLSGEDDIKKYTVTFYQVDPSKEPGEEGYIIGEPIVIKGPNETPEDPKQVPEAFEDKFPLDPGWYEAKLEYTVDTEDESGNKLENVDKEAYSSRILIFKMSAAAIRAEQRVTTASDGVKVYHPVIDVVPDATSSIAALDENTDVKTVSAVVKVEGISTNVVTRITDMEGNDLPVYNESATDMTVEYDRANRTATVHYPQGFFTDRKVMPDMRFAVRNAAIDKRTNFTMTISSSEGQGASSDTYAMVYMPAGQLYGKLVADRVETEDGVAYNALAVSNQDELPEGEPADGYARIRYVDRNNGDNICYIGTMGDTEVKAEIKYVTLNEDGTHETEKVLFDGEKLDMRLNPENQDAVYTSKRLKIAGIPYQTETVKDAAGEEISVRKDQEATFSVQLTYSIAGMDDFISREKETTLEYTEDELTSPRQGLADLKTADDVRGGSASNGKKYATDVTAVTESYVENYGGLFTNIEDAHVALQAVDRNENLVGFNSFNKWYMNHGDKWDEAPANDISNPLNVNPFNPADHRAVGNTKRNGVATYESVEEVHPLLRGNSKVTSSSSFQNTTALNNAWWNTRAYTKPEFHEFDHIKGDFTRDTNGAITGWKSESSISKPRQHREWWAGVKAGNDDKYQVFDGSTVIKDEEKGIDTDIRDPKHSYYGMDSHFTTEDGIRTAYYLGEMPLNANDILAFYGDPTKPNQVVAGYLNDYSSLKNVAMEIHNAMEIPVTEANYGNDGKSSVSIDGTTYTLDIPVSTPWNLDNIWKARAELAFKADKTTLSGKSPAEAIFEAANKHMIFKVNHVNHESWWAPGAYHQIVQLDIKTRPIWGAFKGVKNGEGKTIDDYTSDADKEKFVMGIIRMNLDDYCPLAYDVRYTYPFLTTEKVTAENYNNAVTARSATDDFSRIANMYATVTESDITDVAARDTGRVPFFDKTTMSPDEIVPTAIADVNADIRGNGFSIIYNRAAGTVTISAEGDRELKEAAVYDATGASLVRGASADRVNDQTIVLDVRGIAQGAYVISTNLGGAKFMK